MAWTAPRTWVAGELVTKALLDEQIRDNELVLHDDVASMIPEPVEPVTGVSAGVALAANNTTAHLGVVRIPRPITTTRILYNISAAGGGATSAVRITLYSEDGQTIIFNVTDVCGANTGIRPIDIAATIEAGNYILLICHSVYNTSAKVITRFVYDVTFCSADYAGYADLSGTLTIAGGAAPATIDPTAFTTVAAALIPVVRFLGTP